MEIGSFIELQFPQGMEFYAGDHCRDLAIARLNSGKAALYHAFRVTGCGAIWLPYYQCDSVRDFFVRKQVKLHFYHIDRDFMPVDLAPGPNDAVMLVNYYGIMSEKRMRALCSRYEHVIVDNCQSFFSPPVELCLNVYSCRKFIGVPDGAYVIGSDADRYLDQYPQCYSSDTALFLLLRIEHGCEGKSYQARSQNERRLENEDVMVMSRLTTKILAGTDYSLIQKKRQENFDCARSLFDEMNGIALENFTDGQCVPMVYPLVVESDELLGILQRHKHFQGNWWRYLWDETPVGSMEYWLSKYMIPITIDQRYGEQELNFLHRIVTETLQKQ